jgi:hypothetical protein
MALPSLEVVPLLNGPLSVPERTIIRHIYFVDLFFYRVPVLIVPSSMEGLWNWVRVIRGCRLLPTWQRLARHVAWHTVGVSKLICPMGRGEMISCRLQVRGWLCDEVRCRGRTAWVGNEITADAISIGYEKFSKRTIHHRWQKCISRNDDNEGLFRPAKPKGH